MGVSYTRGQHLNPPLPTSFLLDDAEVVAALMALPPWLGQKLAYHIMAVEGHAFMVGRTSGVAHCMPALVLWREASNAPDKEADLCEDFVAAASHLEPVLTPVQRSLVFK